MPAVYPVLPLSLESRVSWSTPRDVGRASNGAVRVRVMGRPRAVFSLRHSRLTLAQRDALRAFVAAQGSQLITYTWPADGQSYSVVITRDLAETPLPGGRVDVDIELSEV